MDWVRRPGEGLLLIRNSDKPLPEGRGEGGGSYQYTTLNHLSPGAGGIITTSMTNATEELGTSENT